jgi:hypothetical protein
VDLNLNPNAKDEAVAMTRAGYREKIESVLKLRCPEHDKNPQLEIVEGRPTIETCCDAFEEQVKEALER